MSEKTDWLQASTYHNYYYQNCQPQSKNNQLKSHTILLQIHTILKKRPTILFFISITIQNCASQYSQNYNWHECSHLRLCDDFKQHRKHKLMRVWQFSKYNTALTLMIEVTLLYYYYTYTDGRPSPNTKQKYVQTQVILNMYRVEATKTTYNSSTVK